MLGKRPGPDAGQSTLAGADLDLSGLPHARHIAAHVMCYVHVMHDLEPAHRLLCQPQTSAKYS